MASLTDPLKGQPETRISDTVPWVYYRPVNNGVEPIDYSYGDPVEYHFPNPHDPFVGTRNPAWAAGLEYRYKPLRQRKVSGWAVAGVLPDGNPKTAAGAIKTPMLSVIPPTALIQVGEVMRLGKGKYGAYNWRDQPVTYSTYVDAAMRHLISFWDGETVDPESGESHLAHGIAGLMVLIDAIATGNATDDRPSAGPSADLIRARAALREAQKKAA